MYFDRLIDKHLIEWKDRAEHKPVLLRGARQVGKSTAVRHLGESFRNLVEINFERNPEFSSLFKANLDARRIVSQISAISGKPVVPGETLLFLDEIQECKEAIMSLRFFKEELPALHVIAAGSLLEFALDELPTFGVGRIHSIYIHPFSFDEFLSAVGEGILMDVRNQSSASNPLPDALHTRLVSLLRTFILVGGMPEAVAKWVATGDYLQCQEVLDDIVIGYESDFPKYRKKCDPELLRKTLHSCALQVTEKFVYSRVGAYKTQQIRDALDLLIKAGLVTPVSHTSADGVPLGSGSDGDKRKILVLDTGILLRLLNMERNDAVQTSRDVLTLSEAELVNKGPVAEMLFGLEYLRYQSPHFRHELYYWVKQSRNSLAEVDYLTLDGSELRPVEVKASRQGGMKSLWMYMSEKNIKSAVRCSLENFGIVSRTDLEEGVEFQVSIYPLYAVSMLC